MSLLLRGFSKEDREVLLHMWRWSEIASPSAHNDTSDSRKGNDRKYVIARSRSSEYSEESATKQSKTS